MGGDDGRDRLHAGAGGLAAQGFFPHDRNRCRSDWHRYYRRSRSPGQDRLSRRTCPLVRGKRLYRHAPAQFRRLCGGACRLHRGDPRQRCSGTGWNDERRRHLPCDQSRDRDLHGHPVRGRRAGLDRYRPFAAKARGGACLPVDGDHGRVRRLFSDRQLGPHPVSRASTRPLAAHHCARSDDRRSDWRGLRPPLSLAGIATSGVRPRGNDLGVAQGCI